MDEKLRKQYRDEIESYKMKQRLFFKIALPCVIAGGCSMIFGWAVYGIDVFVAAFQASSGLSYISFKWVADLLTSLGSTSLGLGILLFILRATVWGTKIRNRESALAKDGVNDKVVDVTPEEKKDDQVK
ncbi:MAG: hypothetical protein WC366_02505 [Bacilli bacterium]|jgi:uncharacterized membrane protein